MRYFEVKFISDGEVVYAHVHDSNSKLTAINIAMNNCNNNHFNLEDNKFEMKVIEIPKKLI